MAKKDGEKRDVQIKISGTRSLKALMDEFVSAHPKNFNSMNTLVDRAVHYLVKRYEEAGGRIDDEGFPLDFIAEERPVYRRDLDRPKEKKRHGSPS
ncbi:MAG: hypothetical protein H8K09_13250 [Nitrospira sp.]|nr:hypothetical protein [Nitrospira sp.]